MWGAVMGALVGGCAVVGGVVRGVVGACGAGVIVVDMTNAGTGVSGRRSDSVVLGVGTVVVVLDVVVLLVAVVVVVVAIGKDNAAFTELCHSPQPLAFGSTAETAKFPSTIVAAPVAAE